MHYHIKETKFLQYIQVNSKKEREVFYLGSIISEKECNCEKQGNHADPIEYKIDYSTPKFLTLQKWISTHFMGFFSCCFHKRFICIPESKWKEIVLN